MVCVDVLRRVLGLVLLGSLPACSSSSSPRAAQDAGTRDAAAIDSAAPETGALDAGPDSAPDVEPPTPEAGADAAVEDAAAEASPCIGLGAPCVTSETCLCGEAAGCELDNVACVDAGGQGRCETTSLPDYDASPYPCCSECEYDYDTCTPVGSAACMSAWAACNDACKVDVHLECAVRCVAQ